MTDDNDIARVSEKTGVDYEQVDGWPREKVQYYLTRLDSSGVKRDLS